VKPACASAALLLSACLSYTQTERPVPAPPAQWQPRDVLRAQIAGGAGDVIVDDRDGLSPDEAALLAVDRNPRLRAIRAERGLAEAEIIAAGLLPNPRLGAALDVPTGDNEALGLGFGAGVDWNVSPLWSRARRVEAAESAAHSVDLEVGWQEWQVAQAARLHAARIIHLTRRLGAAREIETSWQARLGSLGEALTKGAVTTLEVAAAERALAEAHLASLDLEQDIARERAQLNGAIGLAAEAEPNVDAQWRAPQDVQALSAWLERAPERRLDLIALRHAQSSRDSALRAAVAAQFPALEIGVRAGRDLEQNSSVGVTLTLDLPFFDRNQASVVRARAERSQLEADYDARLLEARSLLTQLFRELELVRQKLASADAAAESSTRLATLGRASALAGGISPLAAADLEERAFGARLRQLEIAQSAAELWIALVTAAGTDLP
jgi:outer membrane protein TolC